MTPSSISIIGCITNNHIQDFAPVARAVVALPKEIKQYALFAGPRLDSVIAYSSVALVGDASHRNISLIYYIGSSLLTRRI